MLFLLLAQIIACWLAADFLSGFWHWIEDRYFEERWPIIGKYIAKPNALHHAQPAAFLAAGYWKRNWTTILPAVTALALSWSIGAPWQVLLVFAFASQANEIHALAHQRAPWRIVRGLQEFGLLQSPRHHAEHHRSPFNVRYCVMSDWLNPLLDRVHFWVLLEKALQRVGVSIREDARAADQAADQPPAGSSTTLKIFS